jgi:hypothetical protein
VIVYCSLIRSVLEYACAVWHSGLTVSQSNEIERVQKRCLRIIFPDLLYSEALAIARLDRLDKRRDDITRETFALIKQPTNVLHYILNDRYKRQSVANIRSVYSFLLPIAKTHRYLNSFSPIALGKDFKFQFALIFNIV